MLIRRSALARISSATRSPCGTATSATSFFPLQVLEHAEAVAKKVVPAACDLLDGPEPPEEARSPFTANDLEAPCAEERAELARVTEADVGRVLREQDLAR